ncbi:hypothetical protein [Rhizobium sp. BK060]|uniref:hypothetical protein n=1 Tax=Rhizobium sp. BK060 TaxID=2587096 RepID=UPI00160C4A47|nr:hypothetical protein [Rhizobium sp. BK060]MBB3396027.1 hypothetical protein [Rhizobium sp. BK060]
MSKVIAINFGRKAETDAGVDCSKNADLQRLEQGRLELIEITNYLEALRACLIARSDGSVT